MHDSLGLGSSLPSACRRALCAGSSSDAAAVAHLAACASCAERWRIRERSGELLALRPSTPVELAPAGARLMLERIHERIIEAAEASPIAEDLSALPQSEGMPAPELPEVATEATQRWLRSALAQSAAPLRPDADAWSRVRSSILADVAAQPREAAGRSAQPLSSIDIRIDVDGSQSRHGRSSTRRWTVSVASMAAASVLGFLVLSLARSGDTAKSRADAEGIVFIDLQHAPDVDFAVVRYGIRR